MQCIANLAGGWGLERRGTVYFASYHNIVAICGKRGRSSLNEQQFTNNCIYGTHAHHCLFSPHFENCAISRMMAGGLKGDYKICGHGFGLLMRSSNGRQSHSGYNGSVATVPGHLDRWCSIICVP